MPKLCIEVTTQELNAINTGYAVGITRENILTLTPPCPDPVVKRLIIVSQWGNSFEVVTVNDELYRVKQLTRGNFPRDVRHVPDRPRTLNVWMRPETGSFRLWWDNVKRTRDDGTSKLIITEVPLASDTPRP